MNNVNKSGVVLKPSLPSPQGSLGGYGGSFKVSGFTGAGEISLGGIAYNISQGNGEYGFGFGTAGGTGVSRSTHRNTPTFDDELDTFELNGSILVPYLDESTGERVVLYGALEDESVTITHADDSTSAQTWKRAQLYNTASNQPYLVRQYRPRTEGSYAKIYYWKYIDVENISSDAPSSFWLVISGDNSMTLFGVSDTAKVSDRNDDGSVNPNKVCSWLTEEHLDASGHSQLTKYVQENTEGLLDNSGDFIQVWEANHVHHNKIYLDRVCSGHATPLPAPLSLVPAANRTQNGSNLEPEWFFETVWDYGQYDIYNLSNQNLYTPSGSWTPRQDAHSTYVSGFEIRCHRLCRHVLEFHRFPEEFGVTTPLLHSATAYIYDESSVRTLLVAAQHIGYYWDFQNNTYTTNYTTPVEMAYADFNPKPADAERPYRELKIKQNDTDSGQAMTALAGIAGPFLPVDLYSEGINGMLASDGQEAYYYQIDWDSIEDKLGTAEPVYYQRSENPVNLPYNSLLQDGNHQLMDINGNARLDYVTHYGGQLGYFEALQNEHEDTTGAPINTWGDFTPIPLTPSEIAHPRRFFVDLTGNKIADCLLPFGQGKIRYYKNNGPEGFEPAQEVDNEYLLPEVTSFLPSPEVFIGFVGIAGDGKQHLVRMDKTSLVYYPNIGYGKFGKPVTMGNYPAFSATEFHLGRIHFADLDGSGTADLVVAKRDGIEVYLNQCGNQFATTPIVIAYPAGDTYNDHTTRLLFEDVFGNGLTCMIYQKMGPNARQWVYDFNGGAKPYLMTQHINNMGAVTETTYRSSVHFYLEDLAEGMQWFTRAPFPVWSVHEVKVTDLINDSVISETYRYRHSYYDGEEKAFRGYGYAEHTDVVESNNTQGLLDSPPAKSCMWYYGGNPAQETINRLYEKFEYFMAGEQSLDTSTKDVQVQYLPTYNYDFGAVTETTELHRQAQLHLAGTLLRSEIYGKHSINSIEWELYTTSMTNETVHLVQTLMPGEAVNSVLPLLNYASFQVLPRESLGYHYERQLEDPMVGYTAAIAFDDYGHVLQNCTLQYPRRADYVDTQEVVATEQQALRCTTSLTVLQNVVDPANDLGDAYSNEQCYLLGIPTRQMSYYVRNSKDIGSLDGKTGDEHNLFTEYIGAIFSYEQIQEFLQTTNPNEASPAFKTTVGGEVTTDVLVDLLSCATQHFYYVQADTNVAMPAIENFTHLQTSHRPGNRGFLLPKGNTSAVFEKAGLEAELVGNNFFQSATLTGLMETTGKYQTLSHTTNWGGTDQTTDFWATHPGTYTYGTAAQFYSLQSYTDPMGSTSTTTYDRYNLMPIENSDALGNTSSIAVLTNTYSDGTAQRAIDYQLMHPFRLIDLNDNSSEVLFDALGRVVASTHYGSYMQWDEANNAYVEATEGFGRLYAEGTSVPAWAINTPANAQAVIAAPMDYLGNAANFIFYQPFAWMGQVLLADLIAAVNDSSKATDLTTWYTHLQSQGLVNGEGAVLNRLRALTLDDDGITATTAAIFFARLTAIHDLLDVAALSLTATQKEALFTLFATNASQTPAHVLTTSIKDYPEVTHAVVTESQLLALGETDTQVAAWLSTAYAAGFLIEETEKNNGQSTFGRFTLSLRTALEASTDAATFASNLGTGSVIKSTFEAFANQEAVFTLYQQALGERIEQGLQYSDGLGRPIQHKVKAEAGKECFLYNASSQSITSNTSSNPIAVRWLTQGHQVYNNKGQLVLAYDPYYIDTPLFVESNDFKLLGTSPVNYYDGLGRVTYSITPKGYMVAKEWTAWQETAWDTNDCLWLSPYFQVNRQYFNGTVAPQSQHDADKYYFDYSDEKLDTNATNYNATIAQSVIATIQKSLKQGFSPVASVHDNRGLILRARQKSGYKFTPAQIAADLAKMGITTTDSEAQGYYDALKTAGYLNEHTLGDALQANQEVILQGGIKIPLTLGNQTETLVLNDGTLFALMDDQPVTLAGGASYTPTNSGLVSVVTQLNVETLAQETLFLLWESGITLPQQLKEASAVVHSSGTTITLIPAAEITLASVTAIGNGTQTLVLHDTIAFNLRSEGDVIHPDQTTTAPEGDNPRIVYLNEDAVKFSGLVDEVGFYLYYETPAFPVYTLVPEGSQVVHESGTVVTLVADASVEITYADTQTSLTLQGGQTLLLEDGTSVTLPSATQITTVGDQFLVTPYEVWSVMTDAYSTEVMSQIQELITALEWSQALQIPVILTILWQAKINAQTVNSSLFQTKVQEIVGKNEGYATDYDALINTLETLGWLSEGTVTSQVTYPDLGINATTNPTLNLLLMLGWAAGEIFETSYQYDEYGRPTHIADPRFTRYNDDEEIGLGNDRARHNQETTYIGSLGGSITSHYCDAGQHWTLPDVLGRHLWSRDMREIVQQMTYDALHRPVALKQTAYYSFATALDRRATLEAKHIQLEEGGALSLVVLEGEGIRQQMTISTYSEASHQRWQIAYHSSEGNIDYYQIKTEAISDADSIGIVKVNGKSVEPGATIKAAPNNTGKDHELWRFELINGQYVAIINKKSGLAMTYKSESLNVIQDVYGGNADQHWKINMTAISQVGKMTPGVYYLRNAKTGLVQYCDQPNGSILQQTYTGEGQQKFRIHLAESAGGIDYYIIESVGNGEGFNHIISGQSEENGAKIDSADNTDSSSQNHHWMFEHLGNGRFTIKSRWIDRILQADPANESAEDATIQSWIFTGDEAQEWILEPAYEWSAVVSRIAYGESVTDAEKYNLRGQVIQSMTQGLWSSASGGFNILGLPLGGSIRFAKAYVPASGHTVLSPCLRLNGVTLNANEALKTSTLSDDLSALLQAQAYEQSAMFDATGEMQRSIDAAQNVYTPHFYLSGGLGQMKVNGIDFMDEVVLNARKQKLSVKTKNATGNLVTQCHYTYDPKNYGLLQMYATHGDSEVSRDDEYALIFNGFANSQANTRQNLIYTFDPMGNVAAVPVKMYQGPDAADNTTTHVFKNSAAYEYDGLYRLVKAQETSDS